MNKINKNQFPTNQLNQPLENHPNKKPIALPSNKGFAKVHKYVFIKVGNSFDKISVEDIFWIESNQIHCRVQMKQNTYDLQYSLEACLERFQHPDFIRIHDLYVVNLQKIKSIVQIGGKKYLELSEMVITTTSSHLNKQITGGDKIPISRKYLKTFSEHFYTL